MPCGPVRPSTVVDVVIFTTEGLIFSASGAKLSGFAKAMTDCNKTKASANIPIIKYLRLGVIASDFDRDTAFGCMHHLQIIRRA